MSASEPSKSLEITSIKSEKVQKESPYEKSFINKLFFCYMGHAMNLANDRAEYGKSLKGNFQILIFLYRGRCI